MMQPPWGALQAASRGTLRATLQPIDQQSLDAGGRTVRMVENHRLRCIAAKCVAIRPMAGDHILEAMEHFFICPYCGERPRAGASDPAFLRRRGCLSAIARLRRPR